MVIPRGTMGKKRIRRSSGLEGLEEDLGPISPAKKRAVPAEEQPSTKLVSLFEERDSLTAGPEKAAVFF